MNRDTLYIVMPAYNEEANIEAVVNQWYPILAGKSEGSRLVIADSGSSDRTHEMLEGLKATHGQLEILTDCDRQHGPKLIAMYNYAIKNGADYVFQTDSDGQTNPDEFAAFWDNRDKYDAIIGNRTKRGDGASRAFVEKVVVTLLRLYFGIKVPDANAPFRLMKCSLVAKYIDRMPIDYNLPNIMLTTFYAFYKENIVFKEISFKPRKAGKNSINIRRIVVIGWKALDDFKRFKKGMRKV